MAAKRGALFSHEHDDIMRKSLLILVIVIAGCNQSDGDKSVDRDEATKTPPASGIVYKNPRVYNVDYSFEMFPDPNKVDRGKDLKLWIPIPREWDSQKAVKIISVQPEPHARYVDPEYGNHILFWDFGKEPEKPLYKVEMKYRLERYETYAEVDPNKVGTYDKESKEYALYTRSTHTVCVNDKIEKLAEIAVGNEKKSYLQAKRILKFVLRTMRFKPTPFERGIKDLLDSAVRDEKTGKEYYQGGFDQYSTFFVALCRAVGIPARCITEISGWGPWMTQENIRPMHEWHGRFPGLSPDGLAAAQIFGPVTVHVWADFYAPNYGWIPVVTAFGGRFGRLENKGVIISKGRDINIGLFPSAQKIDGYGEQWVLLHNGRADILGTGVWNIANIHTAKVKILHCSDPFPADALAGYPATPYPEAGTEQTSAFDGRQVLTWIDNVTREWPDKRAALAQAAEKTPWIQSKQELFICHMLREVVGDKKFFDISDAYVNLRVNSGKPVTTERFERMAEEIYGKPLDWFFEQWLERDELPQLKLDEVTVSKADGTWRVHGKLWQKSDSIFRLPIELALDTKDGREKQTIWMDTKAVEFDFCTLNEPQKLIVDPYYEVLKIQKMPPHLGWFWDVYPEIIIVYGTLGETEANKTAAERFNNDWIGLDNEIIKPDTDVNEADLKTKCVVLIGRPETNKLTRQFSNIFPIKFDEDKFIWQGVTYSEPSQGVAQIIKNPNNAHGLMMMYAGLSPEATQEFPDSYVGCADRSYVIFDGDRQLVRGDWEDADSNLYWKFDTQ